jgi:hypothetical protein
MIREESSRWKVLQLRTSTTHKRSTLPLASAATLRAHLLHLDAISLKNNGRRLLGMAAWNRLVDFDCTSKLFTLS